jgi:hypothetical protein
MFAYDFLKKKIIAKCYKFIASITELRNSQLNHVILFYAYGSILWGFSEMYGIHDPRDGQ